MPHNESPGKQLWLRKAAQECHISLHAPSRNTKANNQTQTSPDHTLLLPRSFFDDKEAGAQFSAWEWLGQTLTQPFPAQSGDEFWHKGRAAVWKVLQITQTTEASLPSLKWIVPAPGSAASDRAPSWIFPNKRCGEAESVRRVPYSVDQTLLGNREASGHKSPCRNSQCQNQHRLRKPSLWCVIMLVILLGWAEGVPGAEEMRKVVRFNPVGQRTGVLEG